MSFELDTEINRILRMKTQVGNVKPCIYSQLLWVGCHPLSLRSGSFPQCSSGVEVTQLQTREDSAEKTQWSAVLLLWPKVILKYVMFIGMLHVYFTIVNMAKTCQSLKTTGLETEMAMGQYL